MLVMKRLADSVNCCAFMFVLVGINVCDSKFSTR